MIQVNVAHYQRTPVKQLCDLTEKCIIRCNKGNKLSRKATFYLYLRNKSLRIFPMRLQGFQFHLSTIFMKLWSSVSP